MKMRFVAIFLALTGCFSTYGGGRLDPAEGYVASDVPLRVAADGLDALDARWLVDSHRPGGAPRGGWNYVHIRATDWDDDGAPSRYRSYVFHMRMKQRTGAGEMWLQSRVLEPDEQNRDLRHLADEMMSNLEADRTTNEVRWNPRGRAVGVQRVEEGLEVNLLDRMDGQLHGQEAHLVTFETSRGDGAARLALLLVRASYRHVHEGTLGKVQGWPVLLVAGYANGPSDFAGGMPDFDRFVRSIEMGTNAERFGPPPRDDSAEAD